MERSTPTLSPGALQRLRLTTQVHSNLFGVVYLLDEPCAGLHPADTEALLSALEGLKASGNSLFVVEHDLDVDFPLGVLTPVTGISGSGKSSLVSQALVELVAAALGHDDAAEPEEEQTAPAGGQIAAGLEGLRRLLRVDQKPIARTPRSNLATTPASSITSAASSPRPGRRGRGATTPAASPSTSRRAAARPAKAKASSSSTSRS